jgi:hypothetical protein
VFERFSDRARRVLVLAQEEARLLNHSFIGTEHILLGLIHESDGVAAKALESLGVSLEAVRTRVHDAIGDAPSSVPTGSPPFTPRAKKVLELSLREAMQLRHNYIGTEHMLLGLVREGEGVAADVLGKLGLDLALVRDKVIELLGGDREDETEGRSPLRGGGPPGLSQGSISNLHPTKVVQGPDVRLSAGGLEFRVVAVLLFDYEFHVVWRMSGIPKPILDLLDDHATHSPNPFISGPGGIGMRRPGPPRPRPVPYGDWRPFLKVSDDVETIYSLMQGTFDPQIDGEWAGQTSFSPGILESAKRLRVEWQDLTVALDL